MRLKSLECDSLNQEIRDTKARLEQYKKEKENLYEGNYAFYLYLQAKVTFCSLK